MAQRDRLQLLAPFLIIAAGFAAYSNSFSGAFVFDDQPAIVDNPLVRKLSPAEHLFSTPAYLPRRPVLSWSLALNYALGALDVRGYHAANLAIHLLAALVLFGILRRTFKEASTGLALASALLWTVHPLQTQSVTYVIQRSESLMGLFYLLSVYGLIRAARSKTHRNQWHLASALSCALGMGVKPVMITAPLAVLGYDRVFLSSSFKEALAKRKFFYLGLAASWFFLAALVLTIPKGAGLSAGFEIKELTPWQYAATQLGVILHYLKLSVWPHPLALDYAWPVARTAAQILLPFFPMLALGALTGFLWLRFRELGFLFAWFFLTLLPSSSFIPIADLCVEYRMYLPLASVITIAVLAAWKFLDRRLALVFFILTVVVFTRLTWMRNLDYRSNLSILTDTVQKRPHNHRAHYNLANELMQLNRLEEARAHLLSAVRLKPDDTKTLYNLGNASNRPEFLGEAIAYYRKVLELNPQFAEAHNNLAVALQQSGQTGEAEEQFKKALELKPDFALAHNDYGFLLVGQGRLDEAETHLAEALRLRPDLAGAQLNLAEVYRMKNKMPEALAQYEQALRYRPDSPEVHNSLGFLLTRQGHLDEAVRHLDEALRLKPDYAEAHNNLGIAQAQQERFEEAAAHFEEALRLNPAFAKAHFNLGLALARQNMAPQAIEHFKQAILLNPDYDSARHYLDVVTKMQAEKKNEAA